MSAVATITREEVARELASIEKERQRRYYVQNPDVWVKDRLGEKLWSKQIEIMQSIVENRRTAVPSAFDTGKSFIASRIAAWWIDTHPVGKAFVISTASNFPQVKNILWRELGRAHSKGKLLGRLNQTSWYITMDESGREEVVAFGRKPDDTDETGFHGIHTRWVLAIIDEAAGVNTVLHDSIEGLITNEESRILSIGNPDDSSSEFCKVSQPGSGWHVIQISAFDTPNFTGEDMPEEVKRELVSELWVEEKKKKWGETSSSYVAKVLGQFPESNEDGLIPVAWIKAAMSRTIEPSYDKDRKLISVKEYGVDVGAGSDKSIIAKRVGGRVRITHKGSSPDTMRTTGEIVGKLKGEVSPPILIKVDRIGIGAGIADRLIEQGYPCLGINVANVPRNEEDYRNLRAEGYWGLRERFETGTIDIDPHDDDLIEQLREIRYWRTSSGKVQIEDKAQFIKRLGHSPDEMDAVMLAFLVPNELEPIEEVEILEF